MFTETHRGYYTTEEETTNKSKKVAWFTFGDNDFADKVELDLSNRELIQEDGKWFVVKKEKDYPKTYEECCKVLNLPVRDLDILDNMLDTTEIIYSKNLDRLLNSFRKLLICRDAYWKIAGEEMGLGKPWEPDFDNMSTHREYITITKGCFTYSITSSHSQPQKCEMLSMRILRS